MFYDDDDDDDTSYAQTHNDKSLKIKEIFLDSTFINVIIYRNTYTQTN